MFAFVKRYLKLLCFAGLFALALRGLAIAADDAAEDANPYKHITERNVFAIKPPPPPPDPNDAPPPPAAPLAKVVLTGILNVLGPPRALLEVVEQQQPGKQPATPNTTSRPILREGEREGSIEVLSIDVEKNLVRIKNGNVETNLTFEVQKQAPTTMVAAAPPVPVLQQPPGAGAHAPGTAEAETGRRGVVVAGAQTANAPNTIGAQPNPTLQLPARQIRSTQGLQQQPGATTAGTDPVAQWVQLKAQEERARQQRTGFPPVPPAPGVNNTPPTYPPPPPQ
jgi:hypothetical protein